MSVEKDVLRLEVSVDDALGVQVLQSQCDLRQVEAEGGGRVGVKVGVKVGGRIGGRLVEVDVGTTMRHLELFCVIVELF